jgi:hypothetical protein
MPFRPRSAAPLKCGTYQGHAPPDNKFPSLPLGELGIAVESERPLRASPVARVATDHDPDLPDLRGPLSDKPGIAP